MRRGGLYLKYMTLFVGLVTGALVVNGALDLFFLYQDSRRAAIDMQRDKADAAAKEIQSFVREIEHQLDWVTGVQWASSPLHERQFYYAQLLRLVRPISELTQLDQGGREKLRKSRFSIDVVASNIDRSSEPAFTEAMANKVYFGPIYFLLGSEPHFDLSVAHRGRSGVTVAGINLTLIWDVISQIKVGHNGYAYVVDRSGVLVAHPDKSLVLRGTDLSRLPQVAEALKPQTRSSDRRDTLNYFGTSVLSANASIPALHWIVFVESPTAEIDQPVVEAGLRSLAVLILGLLIAGLAAALLARRMVGPIRALQVGAQRIGSGELAHRLSIRTGDELELLAEQFNLTAAALEESHSGLEQKIEGRTAELRDSLDQQTATAEVLRVISQSPTDVQPVLDAVVSAARRFCGATDALIALRDGSQLVVTAYEGPLTALVGDRRPLDRTSITGRAIVDGRTIHIPDIDALNPAEYPTSLALSREHKVRAALAAPMLREDVAVGSIMLRKTEAGEFTPRQIELLISFVAQAVIAIENVHLFTEIHDKSRQLEIASEHKSQFLANMSHELRTPLNAIIGYTELMADGIYGDVNDKAQNVLERVQINSRHLLGLINDVLDLSKIEAGQLTLVNEEYSVADMVKTLVVATESLARTKGLTLTAVVAAGLPTGTGDARRLTQVLLNVLGNAIKYTDQGGVEIRVAQVADCFEMAVVDSGPGIAPEDQERIFAAFQQIDSTVTRKKGGTGLGLSISRRIVELHGGRITVESQLGKGSTFKISIPVNAASV